MTKDIGETEKKVKDGKKASRGAEKIKKKNDIQKDARKIAKKAGDKALLDMAAAQPAGGAKSLLQVTATIDKLEAQREAINLAIRGERAKLKEMKIELRVYDHVRKLRKMEPEDAKAFKATEALYTESLGLELSPEQKERIEEINKQREAHRKSMEELNGGDSGKEVGSGTAKPPIGHNSTGADDTEKQEVPEKNEEATAAFRGTGGARLAH